MAERVNAGTPRDTMIASPSARISLVTPYASSLVGGGAFILDESGDPLAIWGLGEDVLLADGESLIIAGAQGIGKTTLAQQLALGRAGAPGFADLLGYPIQPGAGRVLYLAMDRPRQVARSFRRMVTPDMRAPLDDRLRIWPGPPPHDVARNPDVLVELANAAGADTLVVDSIKDAALGLTEDEVGAGYNRARQRLVASGVQLIEVHHTRKEAKTGRGALRTLDDIYGSTWITAGAGSILLLTGSPGDPIVQMIHIKQPAAPVGPLTLVHDHDRGRTTVHDVIDLVALARATPDGLTARDAAVAIYGTISPTPAMKEKARRRLDKLTASRQLQVLVEGDRASREPKRWVPLEADDIAHTVDLHASS